MLSHLLSVFVSAALPATNSLVVHLKFKVFRENLTGVSHQPAHLCHVEHFSYENQAPRLPDSTQVVTIQLVLLIGPVF